MSRLALLLNCETEHRKVEIERKWRFVESISFTSTCKNPLYVTSHLMECHFKTLTAFAAHTNLRCLPEVRNLN